MRIEQLSLALRARNAWEAFDLGIALARQTGLPLFAGFALPYVAFAVLVNLALWGQPTLAAIAVWWFKPVFDRIALHVLAQAVFGTVPNVRATLRGLRAVPRSGLFAALTLERFDFARSFHLPVAQLEGQTGRAGRARRRLLDRRTRSHAVWLTVVVIHFVYVLILGFDGLLRLLAPEGVQFGFDLADLFGGQDAGDNGLLAQYLFSAALLAAECILEPLYVAAGFTLYLSRRTSLEGWDLEIAFRRLAARHGAGGAATLALLLALCTGLAVPDAAQAANAPEVAQASAAPGASADKAAIEQILKSPDFREYEEITSWKRKGQPPEDKPDLPRPNADFDFLAKLARVLAELMRILAWVAAIFIAGWLVYQISQRLGWFRGVFKGERAWRPEVMFGMDLRPESLPADIAAAARERLRASDLRGALSLLYRGALAGLVHERNLALRAGDTEGDCVRRVGATAPAAMATYFARLVEAWALLAYARRSPEPALVERLVGEWEQHFGGRTDAAKAAP